MRGVYAGAVLVLAGWISAAAGAAPPRCATAAMKKEVVKGNTRFAFDLYGQLRAQKGNLFLSPFSISTALAMTSAGARGDTLEQMKRTLHFPDQHQLHPGMSALLRGLNPASSGKEQRSELYVANAVWGQKGEPFLPTFTGVLGEVYNAPPRLVDFRRDARGTQQAVNSWVAEQTRGWIKALPLEVDSETKMVLASAIYFKGAWLRPFDPRQTREGPFHLARGKTIQVPMMRKHGFFLSCQDRDAQVLELPFAGKRLAMVIVLPRRPDGLAALEKNLEPERIQRWLGRLKKTEVEVVLPRFKAQCTLELKGPLASLGMRDAFDQAGDFSGIAGSRDLFLAAVAHQAVVEVNEKGATAAAVTGTRIKPRGGPVFKADHPFLFLIRDRETRSLLFLGRLVQPR
jgi:serpin B